MTMCSPTMGASAAVPVGTPCPATGVLGGARASLLPEPADYSADGVAALYQLYAASNREDSTASKITVEVHWEAKRARMIDQRAALERARKAQEEQGGFFDSMGIGSLVGIATANPLLVMADLSMHMARLTPDVLRDFEKEHKSEIEVATKLYCALGNVSALAAAQVGPDSLRAAVALGGLLVQETGVLGKEASDWAGAGMVAIGGCNGGASASVIVADKDSAVADEIRTVERDTQEYTKWVALVGMAVAGAAAIIGSWGTATAPVVMIGVALSAGGFAVTETKCLDPILGKDASNWVGGGMMLSGALISGAGVSAAVGQITEGAAQAARTLSVAGNVVGGLAKARQGLETVSNAATRHEVDGAHREAKKHFFEAQRLQRMVEEIIDTVRDLKDSHLRMSQAVNEAVETQCQTQLVAAGMRA